MAKFRDGPTAHLRGGWQRGSKTSAIVRAEVFFVRSHVGLPAKGSDAGDQPPAVPNFADLTGPLCSDLRYCVFVGRSIEPLGLVAMSGGLHHRLLVVRTTLDTGRPTTYVPIVMECVVQRACKGRPREFDVDEALAAALRVFWTKGYDAASLTDLTDAMGITRPSLYAAFGNKESLFRKALDLYEREKLAYVGEALKAPTSREVAERLLRGALAIQTSDCEPKGCMRVLGSLSCGPEAESIRADLMARRQSSQRALCERMERAKEDGDLPASTDVEGLCAYLGAILGGMTIQASSGASKEQLEGLVETALHMWPSN